MLECVCTKNSSICTEDCSCDRIFCRNKDKSQTFHWDNESKKNLVEIKEREAILLKEYSREVDVLFGLFPEELLGQMLLKAVARRNELSEKEKKNKRRK